MKVRLVRALPPPLQVLVTMVEDAPYGGDMGFAFGCRLAEASMDGSALAAQRSAVEALELEIALDRGRYVLGEAGVLAALEAGAAARVLVGEDSAAAAAGRRLSAETLLARAASSGAEGSILVTQRTPEGTRFCRGLTGAAALLRWVWEPYEHACDVEACVSVSKLASADHLPKPEAEEDDIDFM